MYEQILEELYDVIVEETGIEKAEISESSKIATDLDVNSLELLNVVMAIEEAFGIDMKEDRLRKIKTVGDIAKYVVELKG